MVIRVVVVIGEDGGVFNWKKSEKGVEAVGGVDTFRIGAVVGSSEVVVVSSTLFQTESSWTSVWVLDSEASWTTRDGDCSLRACFLIVFFGVLTTSKGSSLPYHFSPLFGLLSSSIVVHKSSGIGRVLEAGCLRYSFTIALSNGTFASITFRIEPTNANLVGSDIIDVND